MTTPRDKRRAGMIFILVTLFIDILGLGIVIPILPELVKQFMGGDTALAGRYVGVISATYALMQFLFAPIVGALSDRFGRRTVLLLSLLGFCIDYIIQGLAPSIGWLFVGRSIAGIMGASFTTANAYIADISTADDRARNFGLVGVAFGLGFIFGPALGGLLGSIHLRLPFFVAAGLAMVNWLYGFFVLPESLPPERRRPFTLRTAHPLASVSNLRAYPLVAGLALAFVLVSFAQRGLENSWVLYTGYRFGWDRRTIGLSLALVGVVAATVQGGLVRPVVARFGERRAIVAGLSVAVAAFFAYGAAWRGWMMLVIIAVGGLGGIAGPAIQGLVAGTVDPAEQGKIQGSLTSLVSLTSILAPLFFTAGLFSFFTSEAAPFELPGAPFLAGSVVQLAALLVIIRLFRRIPAEVPPASAATESEAPEPLSPAP